MSFFNGPEESAMNTVKKEWNLWCRLCAKTEGQNVDIVLDLQSESNETNLISAINKFFQIRIIREDGLPQVVCTECLSVIKSLAKFALHVSKVQEMYLYLHNLQDNSVLDLCVLREKYGILDEKELRDNTLTVSTDLQKKLRMEKIKLDDLPSEIKVPTSIISEEFDGNNKSKDPLDQDSDYEFFDSPHTSLSDYPAKIDIEETSMHIVEQKSDTDRTSDKELCTNYTTENVSTNNEYRCKECSKTFQNVSTYRMHLKKKHGSPGELFPASTRKRASYKKNSIEKDTVLAEKHVYTCPNCNETFQRKTVLTEHLKSVHGGKGSYVCEECGTVMGSKSALRNHLYTHSKDEPFKCKDCGKRFKHKAFLRKHSSIHGDKHICAECGLQLSSRATLYCHLTVHSDAAPHKCDYCGRAFKRSKTLKNHLIVHTGLRPYSCDFCDKTFTNSTTCRQHKKNVHPKEFAAQEASGEKPERVKNIPKLTTLKEVTRTATNLAPVASKPGSGNFSIGSKKLKKNED